MSSTSLVRLVKFLVLAFVFTLSGCMFLRPDYVKLISPEALNQVLHQQDIFLLDVHIPEQRHIKGTDYFIPYNAIEQHKDKLPVDKNTFIYLYCESGLMGNAAARTLYDFGYHNLSNLEGGTHAWLKQGFRLE